MQYIQILSSLKAGWKGVYLAKFDISYNLQQIWLRLYADVLVTSLSSLNFNFSQNISGIERV